MIISRQKKIYEMNIEEECTYCNGICVAGTFIDADDGNLGKKVVPRGTPLKITSVKVDETNGETCVNFKAKDIKGEKISFSSQYGAYVRKIRFIDSVLFNELKNPDTYAKFNKLNNYKFKGVCYEKNLTISFIIWIMLLIALIAMPICAILGQEITNFINWMFGLAAAFFLSSCSVVFWWKKLSEDNAVKHDYKEFYERYYNLKPFFENYNENIKELGDLIIEEFHEEK